MDTMLCQQTKILDKMNELSTFLINHNSRSNSAISSNVFIFGTQQQQQQQQERPQTPPTQEQQQQQQQQQDDEPLIDISINILDGDGAVNHNAVEYTRFGLIENPLNVSCPITYENFDENSQVSRITSCGHIFNTNGLTTWLSINQTCPTCRSSLNNNSNNNNSRIRRRRRMNTSGSRLRGNIENVLSEITENMLSRFLPIDLSQNVFSREEML